MELTLEQKIKIETLAKEASGEADSEPNDWGHITKVAMTRIILEFALKAIEIVL